MPTKPINLRIDTKLLEYLETRAEREHRTLSNMVISILLDAMERNDSAEWVGWYETIEHENTIEYKPHCKCSACGTEVDPYTSRFIKHCPKCGAKIKNSDTEKDKVIEWLDNKISEAESK